MAHWCESCRTYVRDHHGISRLEAAREGVVKALEVMLSDRTPWCDKAIAARVALKELEEAQK